MSAHICAKAAAVEERLEISFRKRATLVAGACALSLLSAGCVTSADVPPAVPDPSVSSIRVPAVTYRPVLRGYVSQRPVEPAPWREQNERVAPSPRQ
jgi:hypothetical protein